MTEVIPPTTRAVGTADPAGDMDNTAAMLALITQVLAQAMGTVSARPAGNAANVSALQDFATNVSSFGKGLRALSNASLTTISSAAQLKPSGTQGVLLDSRRVYDWSALQIKNLSDALIEGALMGSIGWGGNASNNAVGYIKTDTGSPADGVQIFSDGTAETQGLVFRDLAFKGSHSNAVVHFGGRQRKCAMERCFIQNTSSATGAYALIVDAGLSNFNSEDQYFRNLSLVGAYACLGLSIVSGANWKANDTRWDDLTTASTGPYSIINNDGSNHSFDNYYDRSSPSIATVWNQNGILYFRNGEDLNNALGGACHKVDSGAVTTCIDRALTSIGSPASAQTTLIISGRMIFEGRCRIAGTAQVNSGGVLDISDPRISASNLTISGAGTVYMPGGGYNVGSGPAFASFTGTVVYLGLPAVVATKSGVSQTTTQTLTWTPPASNCSFRVKVMVHPTVVGTSTIASIAFTERGGSARSYNIPMLQQNGSATAMQYNNAAADTFLGDVTSQTDNSGANVTVTITPTGSTYRYAVVIEQLSYS